MAFFETHSTLFSVMKVVPCVLGQSSGCSYVCERFCSGEDSYLWSPLLKSCPPGSMSGSHTLEKPFFLCKTGPFESTSHEPAFLSSQLWN